MARQDYIYPTIMCLFIFVFKENTCQKYLQDQKAWSYLKSCSTIGKLKHENLLFETSPVLVFLTLYIKIARRFGFLMGPHLLKQINVLLSEPCHTYILSWGWILDTKSTFFFQQEDPEPWETGGSAESLSLLICLLQNKGKKITGLPTF